MADIKLNKEYIQKLEERAKQTNWNNLKSIKAYNEYCRRLRSQLEFNKE